MNTLYLFLILITIGLWVWVFCSKPTGKPTDRMSVFIAIGATVLVVGLYFTYFKKPPVSVTHRNSTVGAGYVLQIKNTGNRTLNNIVVAQFGGKVAKVANRLDPGKTAEAGWLEFGYSLPEGTYLIAAKGYNGRVTYDIKPVTALIKGIKESIKKDL